MASRSLFSCLLIPPTILFTSSCTTAGDVLPLLLYSTCNRLAASAWEGVEGKILEKPPTTASWWVVVVLVVVVVVVVVVVGVSVSVAGVGSKWEKG